MPGASARLWLYAENTLTSHLADLAAGHGPIYQDPLARKIREWARHKYGDPPVSLVLLDRTAERTFPDIAPAADLAAPPTPEVLLDPNPLRVFEVRDAIRAGKVRAAAALIRTLITSRDWQIYKHHDRLMLRYKPESMLPRDQ